MLQMTGTALTKLTSRCLRERGQMPLTVGLIRGELSKRWTTGPEIGRLKTPKDLVSFRKHLLFMFVVLMKIKLFAKEMFNEKDRFFI